MVAYAVRRVLLLIPVLLGITFVVFLFIHLIPGNPAQVMLGLNATPQAVATLTRHLGLDRPLWQQFLRYLNQVVHGNLGRSITQYQSVDRLLAATLPNTLELATASMLIAVAVAIPLGVVAATHRGGVVDILSMVFAQLGVSMPSFWLGTLLVEVFALTLRWLPSFGIGPSVGQVAAALAAGDLTPLGSFLAHLALPATTLGLSGAALVSRMVRSAMIQILGQDYVRTAYAKGLRAGFVIWKHAFRNALVTVVTIVGLQFGYFLGGTVIVESIFAWPGMGRLMVNAILSRDFPTVQGSVLVFAALFAIVNLVVDLTYALLNPKLRYQ